RLRLRGLLAGHVRLRHRPLLDRQNRLAADSIEHVQPAFLRWHRHDLARLPADRHVCDDRRRGHVEVPNRVVDELEVPFALTVSEIDARETLGEEVVARSMSTVVIRARCLDWQVDESEILVDTDLRPDADVPVYGPGL